MRLVYPIIFAFNNWCFRIPLLFLFLICINRSVAQSDSNRILKNILFVELGGPGGYGSVNYERTLIKQNKISIQGRMGLSTVHLKNHYRKLSPDIIIPLSIHFCYGSSHKAEIGLGETFTYMNVVNFDNYGSKRNSYFHSFISLGYRYQPIKSRIFARIAYTPILERNINLRQWGSLSLGYQF
jgi:hypothetical protein